MKTYMFVDAETDGLYGKFLSIAAICCNESGEEQNQFYHRLDVTQEDVEDGWVKEQVLPILNHGVLHASEEQLLCAFWDFYESIMPDYVITDVMYPVEARLFERCVLFDEAQRKWKAPFPMLDLSNMLYVQGIDPLIDREKLVDCSDLQKHNALDDVRMSIRIWKKYRNSFG